MKKKHESGYAIGKGAGSEGAAISPGPAPVRPRASMSKLMKDTNTGKVRVVDRITDMPMTPIPAASPGAKGGAGAAPALKRIPKSVEIGPETDEKGFKFQNEYRRAGSSSPAKKKSPYRNGMTEQDRRERMRQREEVDEMREETRKKIHVAYENVTAAEKAAKKYKIVQK